MKNKLFIYIFAVVLSLTTAINAGVEYQLPGESAWKLVKGNPHDQAEFSIKDGVLVLKYQVKTSEYVRVQHRTFQGAEIQLLLKEPVALDKDIERIFFEATGIYTSGRIKTMVRFMPLIQDENGEMHAYTPHPQQHLKNGSMNWSGWKTNSFYSTEAGGASEAAFTSTGGDNNSWPDGKLKLLGFKLAVRDRKVIDYSGTIEFGGFAFGKFKVPYSYPYVYADGILKDKGTYEIGVQVLNKFQDTPVREWNEQVKFDPENPVSAKQKISFELGPDDNYWVRYQVIDANKKVVSTNQMRAWVENNEFAPAVKGIDLKKAPSIGYMRLNPGHKTCGVYERGRKSTFTIRAFAKDQAAYSVSWRIERFAFPEVVQEGSKEIKFKRKKWLDVKFPLQLAAECDSYRLIAQVESAGKIIDTQEYILGFKTDLTKVYKNRLAPRVFRDEIKKEAYLRISFLTHKNGKRMHFKSRQEFYDRFEAALKEISQVTRNVTYMIDTYNFEILPGVYDFEAFDRIMDIAADNSCRLTIRLSHADHGSKQVLRWQRYWPQRNSDNTKNPGKSFYGSFSVADKGYVNSMLAGFKAFYNRYQEHPAFQGYQIFEIAGEWAVLDQPWSGSVVSYEKVAKEAFVEYIKKNITSDLKALNKRWETTYKSWNEVSQPLPTFKLGGKPDLRLHWLDFCEFKHYLDAKYWVQTAAESIREYDKNSVIIIYSLDPGGFEKSDGESIVDYLHNGGNHFLRGEGSLINAWENSKMGWITEPHMPHRWAAYGDKGDSGWLLDWTTYIMLAQAAGGGANMHIYYYPLHGKEDLDLAAHYGREYAFDSFEKWKPLLNEMHDITLKQQLPEIAVMQDIYTLFCKHRTVFEPRLDDLRRWFELMKNDSLTYEDYREENRESYKLVVPNVIDEVMSMENIELIKSMVADGKKTVISAMTGSMTPGKDEKYILLSELGIEKPVNDFTTTSEKVSATMLADSPFGKKGDKFPFYSLADMKNEVTSEELKDKFYQWAYRWLPQTDYFRIYPGQKITKGKVLATFPDGGVALSLHKYGKGEVLVIWGMPDYTPERLEGFMQKVADWADVKNPRKNSPVPLTMEADHKKLNRHYAIMYQDEPGTYKQKLPDVQKGEFFIDDIVSGQRLGRFKSDDLHNGVEWTWIKGLSPLKILRMIPVKHMNSRWIDKYNQ